jgi:hypothetical protein
MQALKDRLIREALEDIEAELTIRAFERQQLLAAIVNGFQPNSRILDMALPGRLLQAAAQIGRGPLPLLGPANGHNGQPDVEEVTPDRQAEGEVKELPPATAATEAGPSAGAEDTQAPEAADTQDLLSRIRELRGQEPPLAWKAVAAELGLSEYRLHQLREQHGL